MMDEINDFLETINAKMGRLGKNLDRVESCQSNTAEKKKL